LYVFDVSATAVAGLTAAGAQEATSAGAIAKAGVEVIITMLPAATHVREVYLGDDGLLANVQPGVLLIDSSTIDPMSAREVAAAAAKNGNPMIDAPVSGGTVGAAAGTLTFMVGGSEADFQKAQPILAAMGKNIVHCGDCGNGQMAKGANIILLDISLRCAAESVSLFVELGMDGKVLAVVIYPTSGRCWSSEFYNPFRGGVENSPGARGYSG